MITKADGLARWEADLVVVGYVDLDGAQVGLEGICSKSASVPNCAERRGRRCYHVDEKNITQIKYLRVENE